MADEVLKKLQNTELSILMDFDTLCRKNNICYFLSCGTLLGAVRHKGFIPWDDDIDVEMPYTEYLKFLKVVDQLPDKYFFQDFQTDPNWYRPHAKIRLQNTAMIENGYTSYKINHGIWIDIFLLIGIRNKIDFRLKKCLITASNYLQADAFIHNSIYEEFEEKLGKIGLSILWLFHRIPMRGRIVLHRFILHCICHDNKKYKYTSRLETNILEMYPTKIFNGEPKYIKFEGHLFPCSPEWDKELTITYGDYMIIPPPEDRQTHYAPIIDFENSYNKYMTYEKEK